MSDENLWDERPASDEREGSADVTGCDAGALEQLARDIICSRDELGEFIINAVQKDTAEAVSRKSFMLSALSAAVLSGL